MADAPAPPRSRVLEAAIAWVLLAGALVGVLLFVGRSSEPAPRPAAGTRLLSETMAIPAAGVSRRLRIASSTRLDVAVELPSGALRVSLGPPQPVEAAPDDRPVPDATVSWVAKPGDSATRRDVLVPGHYVLRLDPEGPAPSAPVRLVVDATPLP